MDTTETHYLTYDPNRIYEEMLEAYIEAGGDVLYPGDEKEILLRTMLHVMIQGFARVDNALRMSTWQYSEGEYLDLYGQKRMCRRLEQQCAVAVVEIKLLETGKTGIIPAGTALTADGSHLYVLDEDIRITGYEKTIRAGIRAKDPGSAGNGLLAGTQMQFIVQPEGVKSVYCLEDAQGGQEREEDEAYRERIRIHGLANVTTGPEVQYESAAMSVSSEILDAKAVSPEAGRADVYLLLSSDLGADAILESVKTALNPLDVRPMSDEVRVFRAVEVPYSLKMQYKPPAGTNLAADMAAVVAEYQKWQDHTIGRAFNPDWLVAHMYQAGAMRVIFGEGSSFDGGNAAYREIAENQCCKGTITLEVIQ